MTYFYAYKILAGNRERQPIGVSVGLRAACPNENGLLRFDQPLANAVVGTLNRRELRADVDVSKQGVKTVRVRFSPDTHGINVSFQLREPSDAEVQNVARQAEALLQTTMGEAIDHFRMFLGLAKFGGWQTALAEVVEEAQKVDY